MGSLCSKSTFLRATECYTLGNTVDVFGMNGVPWGFAGIFGNTLASTFHKHLQREVRLWVVLTSFLVLSGV